MEITLEKIDLLRKRANVSYKEAKEALENNEGNVVEALADLEELNKIKPERECNASSAWKKTKKTYVKANGIRLVITKEDSTILNIGIPLALLVTIVAMPLVAALLVIALITGCRIRFIKNDGEGYGINSTLEDIAEKTSDFADKVAKEIKDA